MLAARRRDKERRKGESKKGVAGDFVTQYRRGHFGRSVNPLTVPSKFGGRTHTTGLSRQLNKPFTHRTARSSIDSSTMV